MEKIYTHQPLKPPGIIQKLLNKKPAENAFVELNNLLADNELRTIQEKDVEVIALKYKINLYKKFSIKLKELYSAYLKFCITDNKLSNQEIEDLNKIKKLLNLKESDIEEIHNNIIGERYRTSYDKAIDGGRLERKDEQLLKRLENNLRIPKALAEEISRGSRKQVIQKYVDEATTDMRLSPTELEELKAISKSLDVKIEMSPESRVAYEKMKLYWVIENGDLPVKEVSINLQKNEKCFFEVNAAWNEMRIVTKRINYAGPTARIRIMKGLSYRIGSVKVERVTAEHLQQIDSGKLYVTNKRLIFVGRHKNSNIKLDKILSIIPYSDGIEVAKDTGRNPIFLVSGDVDILAMTLSRLINNL